LSKSEIYCEVHGLHTTSVRIRTLFLWFLWKLIVN